jgi:hypothetical protein
VVIALHTHPFRWLGLLLVTLLPGCTLFESAFTRIGLLVILPALLLAALILFLRNHYYGGNSHPSDPRIPDYDQDDDDIGHDRR